MMSESQRKWKIENIDKVREYRKKYNKKYYNDLICSENKRKRWTKSDDEMILEKKVCDKELSNILLRGVRAIQIRRSRLKKKL